MKDQHPQLQICVHAIDGSTQMFTQDDPEVVNRTLTELDPTLLFTQERIKVADKESEAVFLRPQVTRIDLITDRLSVWDFPFVLGAPMELTEDEYRECLHNMEMREPPGLRSATSVFLDLEMAGRQRLFLWMVVVGDLTETRLDRIFSMLKERRLIFGHHRNGIGVLNLAKLERFTIHPDQAELASEAGPAHRVFASASSR